MRQRNSQDLVSPDQSRLVTQYNVNLGFAAWELDFFGRIRNLSEQALEEYLATDEGRRGVEIALIGQVARAYFLLAADREKRLADEYAAIFGMPSDEAVAKIEGIMEREDKKQQALREMEEAEEEAEE